MGKEQDKWSACKMNQKAYRVNSETKQGYSEKDRAIKSLMNFTQLPYNIVSGRDEQATLKDRRPMTTITGGKCQ